MLLAKRILPVLMCILILFGMTACGGGDKEVTKDTTLKATSQTGGETTAADKFAKRIKFSATSINLPENVDFMSDDIYKTFDKKFNFEYELINITWETWAEKNRIWISSGDMPDMVFWDFNLKDYTSYVDQGLVKALPKDYADKYPNLGKEIGKTGIGDYLREKNTDKLLYMIPNVIYLNPPTETTDKILDPKVVYYRKDWAEKVGITVGDKITMDELAQLCKAYIDKDPGGNGAGKTVGFTSVPSNVNGAFVQTYNSFYNTFHKVDGKYVWGGTEASTLEGIKNLKKYYDMGIIDKDYYTFKAKEHYDKFDSGLAGCFIDGASAANVNERFVAFARNNTSIDPSKAIGLATLVGPDGKFHGTQNIMNYWAGLLFNPKIEDEKFDRILNILDYICTDEGQRLIFCGIEGRDYKMEGDKIVITREKDANGAYKYIGDLYPSYNFFFTKAVLPDDWSSHDPSLPDAARNAAVNMFRVKERNMDIIDPDYDFLFFGGEKKLKFSLNIDNIITDTVVSGKDIDAQWSTFLKENQTAIDEVINEVNTGIK